LGSDAPRKPASLALLVAAFAAYSGAHFVNNTWLALPAPRAALESLQAASGGWIEPVLVRSQVVLLAFLGVVLLLGRRKPAEIGWSLRKLGPGVALSLVAWALLQLVLVAWVLASGAPLAPHASWARVGVGGVLGGVLTQALGHALVADTVFRGFYLPELRARFLRPGSALVVVALGFAALAASSLLFGLAHLPTRALIKGSDLSELVTEQLEFFSAGLALGLAMLTTRNLFAVVGLHVLLNAPAPLVQVPGGVLKAAILCVFALVVVDAGLRSVRAAWRRRRDARAQAEPAERRAA
jgi:membrane protease YdiL (CAAX protease family)